MTGQTGDEQGVVDGRTSRYLFTVEKEGKEWFRVVRVLRSGHTFLKAKFGIRLVRSAVVGDPAIPDGGTG